MRTVEDVFIKEFKQAVSNVGYKDIFKVPLPESTKNWYVSGTELYVVRDVEAQYYDKLNKTVVKRLPKGMVAKRRVVDKTTRGYKVDEQGKFVYEDYSVPNGSIVVLSPVQLGIPYKGYKTADKEGYGYIDFVQQGNTVEYMYVIPNTKLYKINQLALALSVTNMKNYGGCGYVTWNMGTIFLHVIPYRPASKYVGSRILVTKYSMDFKAEIAELLQYWQMKGVIPNLQLSALSDGSNLALKPTMIGYESYLPVESTAIGDRDVYGDTTEE